MRLCAVQRPDVGVLIRARRAAVGVPGVRRWRGGRCVGAGYPYHPYQARFCCSGLVRIGVLVRIDAYQGCSLVRIDPYQGGNPYRGWPAQIRLVRMVRIWVGSQWWVGRVPNRLNEIIKAATRQNCVHNFCKILQSHP